MTVDHLDTITHTKRKKVKFYSFFREIKLFIVFFSVSALILKVFTNAQLFVSSVEDTLNLNTPIVSKDIKENMYQTNSISSIIDVQSTKEKKVEDIVNHYAAADNLAIPLAKDSELFLSEQLKNYDFKFNTLPPTNRLIVPKFSVNDPIVISQYTNMDEFIYKNYNEELKKWVVKYPTTPSPGQAGNTLIFWHTSEERWKYNPYGMAFANIANIQMWDLVQVVREWKLYEYRILDIQVKDPEDVDAAYQKYSNKSKNYITLMWCYPIGTSKQRILVIGEQISQ